MATVVLDSTNLPAILEDAGVVPEGENNENADAAENKAGTQADAKNNENKSETVAETHADDEEDENGLTAEERASLTAKMQKTIGKKHRMLKEAEEFAAAQYNERKMAETRAAEIERQLEELKGKAVATATPEAKKPVRADFSTESEYIDASIQWGVDQGLKKQAEIAAKEALERKQQEVIQTAKGRIDAAIALVPDFQETVDGADIIVPPAIAGYMQKSELFAELGYYLAKNPDVLTSIAKLAPDEQLVKIGKIEDKLEPFGKKSLTNENGKSRNESLDGKSKDAKGATPSKPAHDKTASSENTEILPSMARTKSAPVISPLGSNGSAAIEINPENIREVITDYAKRNQRNFGIRKRH